MTQPLKLPLWETLHSAQYRPEEVNFGELLQQVEQACCSADTARVAQFPSAERLKWAGEALLRITEIYVTRAEGLITEWEETYRDPVVEQGFFTDLVRQTMAVDLSELMELTPPRKPRTKRAKPTKTEEGSIVDTVDKAAVLAMVDQLEAAATVEEARIQQVLAHPEGSALLCAHDEDVSRWIEAIAQVLRTTPDLKVSWIELCRSLGMPWVEVWLGLLLGGFELEQQGEFYESSIWVGCSVEGATTVEV